MSRAPTAYPVPPNVLVAKSVPQQDILAHPKTRLFVTHGSINAAMESIFHGVPMVTMPIFTDQGRELSTLPVVDTITRYKHTAYKQDFRTQLLAPYNGKLSCNLFTC